MNVTVDVFDHESLLEWLGDSPGCTTVAKVRLICRHLMESARGDGLLLNEWCALYNQVSTVLGQDTSLWMSDFCAARLAHPIDLDAGFANVGAILAELQWGPGSSPAKPGTVERIPYLSALLRPRHLAPHGSAVFTRFIRD